MDPCTKDHNYCNGLWVCCLMAFIYAVQDNLPLYSKAKAHFGKLILPATHDSYNFRVNLKPKLCFANLLILKGIHKLFFTINLIFKL
jgi:hypothetical protein